jgi:5-methylcytosine-specific restriction endonuclease McrA
MTRGRRPIIVLDRSVLREDKHIELVRLTVTLPRMFMGRWALQSSRKIYPDRWKDAQVEAWRRQQQEDPVRLRREGRRVLWWFRNRFYWDHDGHSPEDVKALALQRGKRDERRLKSAHALMKGERAPSRAPIPPEMARAVIKRDGQRCVECGTPEDLQFDHVLPVALGGGTTVENLQVLCGVCNRAKSDSL